MCSSSSPFDELQSSRLRLCWLLLRMHARVAATLEAAEECAHSRRHQPRPLRLPPRRLEIRPTYRPDCNASWLVRRRIVRRDCCRLPRRRSVWPAVRTLTFRWHGRLCLDPRSAGCEFILVVIVARPIFAWWQRRNMPAPAHVAATGHSFGGLSGMLAAPMHRRPANLSPSPSRTMTRSNECSATSEQLVRWKTFRPCVRRSRPRCCPISPSSWRATQVAV